MATNLSTRSSFYDFSALLNQRKAFRTYGSLKGGPVEPDPTLTGWDLGHLDESYYASVRRADYIVWSYATPIAWHVEGFGWVQPEARYSVTTSRHQSKIATAISVLEQWS